MNVSRRITLPLLAAVALLALPDVGIAQMMRTTDCAGAGGDGMSEVVPVRTFYIDVERSRRVYEAGDVAVVRFTVSRPAHEDPAGQGIPADPPTSEPAEGVSVMAVATIGDSILFHGSETDEGGTAVARLRIKPSTPRGGADLEIKATKIVVETACATVVEVGYFKSEDFFRVR